jgi:hypothetical protein
VRSLKGEAAKSSALFLRTSSPEAMAAAESNASISGPVAARICFLILILIAVSETHS